LLHNFLGTGFGALSIIMRISVGESRKICIPDADDGGSAGGVHPTGEHRGAVPTGLF
jgi:hypothetical protein